MAEPAADKPLYGHFGQPVYDRNKKEWHFQRSDQPPNSLQALEGPRVVVPPSADSAHLSRPADGVKGATSRREKQAKALSQIYPELQPATKLLPDLARTSEAVEAAANHHDSSKGSLLAFGKIPDQLAKMPAEVVAFPIGPTGSDLRIMQTQNQSRRWKDSKAIWLVVPTLHGEEATWHGPGVPIQSIHFSTPNGGRDVYLVVRLLVETLIFKPVIRKSISSSSRLDVNLWYRLSIDNTGGSPHAHLSFNLWNLRQFAVVDQAGSWSIREMDGLGSITYKEIRDGHLLLDSNENTRSSMDDGWARISWIGNSDSIVMCNRRTALLCNVPRQTVQALPNVKIFLKDGLGWNLDMAALPSHDGHLALLTSTHILIYSMDVDEHQMPSSELVASLRHYRNPDDLSMRLCIFQDDDDACICVRSEHNARILLYRVTLSWTGRITISDPTSLSLPSRSTSNKLLDMHVQVVSTKQKHVDSDNPSVAASKHIDPSIHFYLVTILNSDLSVLQILHSSAHDRRKAKIVPPSWTGRFPKSTARVPKEDKFVVDSEQSSGSETERRRDEPVSALFRRRQSGPSHKPGQEWTISYERITRQLNNIDLGNVENICESFNAARERLLHSLDIDATPLRTLRDMSDGQLSFNDVNEGMDALQDLFNSQLASQSQQTFDSVEEPEGQRLLLETIAIPSGLNLPHLDRLDTSHESVTRVWIIPLTEALPRPAQTLREETARQIASELTLASHVLRPAAPPKEATEDRPSQSQSQTLNRPPSLPASSQASTAEFFDASSQPQSPTPTPSTITTSSHPSTFSIPALARLSHYMTFNPTPKTPVPLPLPRGLARILSHWQIGADPASYDWTSITRRFQKQDEAHADDEALTEQERRRLQRRTERYVRRQRREAEESQRQFALSSQAPEILVASQPTMLEVEGGSSQGFGAGVASQVVAGRHGGRRPARKKVKKSGF